MKQSGAITDLNVKNRITIITLKEIPIIKGKLSKSDVIVSTKILYEQNSAA